MIVMADRPESDGMGSRRVRMCESQDKGFRRWAAHRIFTAGFGRDAPLGFGEAAPERNLFGNPLRRPAQQHTGCRCRRRCQKNNGRASVRNCKHERFAAKSEIGAQVASSSLSTYMSMS